MNVEIEVISKEIIKPCSPTPTHLRYYQLSSIDQIQSLVYNSCIFFYSKSDRDIIAKSNKLKQSLSKVLTSYYPLAGRIEDNVSVDCNDEGAYYPEAQAKCQLSHIIADSNPKELKKLLPCEPDDATHYVTLAIQVNFFTCGGIAIGVCISHKLADGLSSVMFMKAWASVAEVRAISTSMSQPKSDITKEKLVLKRFVFSSASIAALKAKYAEESSSVLENRVYPTRVEALTALIYSRYIAATQVKFGAEKLHIVLHAVNLRTRMDPPLPEYSFGNISQLTSAILSSETGQALLQSLVGKLRTAIGKFNNDFVKKLQEGIDPADRLRESAGKVRREDIVAFLFSNFLYIYDIDFGWGKLIWVAWVSSSPLKNTAFFVDTKCGDGIETW
ncbi:vinorine synthase, partial [Quercus suber]